MKQQTQRQFSMTTAICAVLITACAGIPERPMQAESKPLIPSAGSYRNPVYAGNLPDPFVLRADGLWRVYATNGHFGNVQYGESKDLVTWTMKGDALPALPSWARGGLTWAPEVAFIGGVYVMYYTARDRETDVQCIGAATSTRPEGPFVDRSSGPLVNQAQAGGSIDASPFIDRDGKAYLYWKNDGNAVGMFTSIYAQALAPDGLSLVGERRELIMNDQLWEGNVVEAPTMHEADGRYYLLYSASDFASDLYGVGVAVGSSAIGPFIKDPDNPLVRSTGTVAGPGHQCLIRDDAGADWIVYHAWTAPDIGDAHGVRSLRIDPIEFRDGTAIFSGPSENARPAPAIRPAR